MGDFMSTLIPKIPPRPLRLLDLPKDIRLLILRHLMKPALRIWDQRQDCLKLFAAHGSWDYKDYGADQSSVWEVTALRTLDEIQSQRVRSDHPVFGTGPGMIDPNKAELIRIHREVKFFVAVGYLNLSYVPRMLLAQELHSQDILDSGQLNPAQCSPDSLAAQAYALLVRLPVSPDSTLHLANATDEETAYAVCHLLAMAETRVIMYSEGILNAWENLFLVLQFLSPNYPRSKSARKAMRSRMQLARELWSIFYDQMKRAEVQDDGQLRGTWFRSNISCGMVKELMDEQLAQEAVAKYGEAIFAHVDRWAKGMCLHSSEKLLRNSSGCRSGSPD